MGIDADMEEEVMGDNEPDNYFSNDFGDEDKNNAAASTPLCLQTKVNETTASNARNDTSEKENESDGDNDSDAPLASLRKTRTDKQAFEPSPVAYAPSSTTGSPHGGDESDNEPVNFGDTPFDDDNDSVLDLLVRDSDVHNLSDISRLDEEDSPNDKKCPQVTPLRKRHKRRKVIIDNDETELSSTEHIKNMIANTSDIVKRQIHPADRTKSIRTTRRMPRTTTSPKFLSHNPLWRTVVSCIPPFKNCFEITFIGHWTNHVHLNDTKTANKSVEILPVTWTPQVPEQERRDL